MKFLFANFSIQQKYGVINFFCSKNAHNVFRERDVVFMALTMWSGKVELISLLLPSFVVDRAHKLSTSVNSFLIILTVGYALIDVHGA